MTSSVVDAIQAAIEDTPNEPAVPHFRLERGGVYFYGVGADLEQLPGEWICSPLDITALTRDTNGENWGRLLEFNDRDGRPHTWAMPMEMLKGSGEDLRGELLRLGLTISSSPRARQRLADYIQQASPKQKALCVDRTGWNGRVYVLPDAVIGDAGGERVLLQTELGSLQGFRTAGTLEQWRESVSALCAGNSRLVFAVSLAFAAKLVALTGDESGGFNLIGDSSEGKTTALYAACSVDGGHERKTTWRTTDNALEGIAALHNDSLLVIDEQGQVDPRKLGEIAYMLANGEGKGRATKAGTPRPKRTWRLLFLSSGEVSLAQHMAEAGRVVRAGQEVRLADLRANAEAGHGLFEVLHGHGSGKALSEAIQRSTRTHYGTAGRAFLATLAAQREHTLGEVARLRRDFTAEHVAAWVNGQVHRVAGRFALVAAAGELATAMGITGWVSGEATRAAVRCYEDWIAYRGGTGAREAGAALAQVRAFFEAHGEARFSGWDNPEERPTANRAGFRRDGNFYVLGETFRKELCKGFEPSMVARLLIERGHLKPGTDGKTTTRTRLPGIGMTRCYVIGADVMADED